jgi:hypothetical protein
MDKSNILNIIKYNYINQFKSLNYNKQNKYPITWSKSEFTNSIIEINKNRSNKLLKDEYIDAIIIGLNLKNINDVAYNDALNELKSKNIYMNITDFENAIKEYINQNISNPNELTPTNAINNVSLINRLKIILEGNYSSKNNFFDKFIYTAPSVALPDVFVPLVLPDVPIKPVKISRGRSPPSAPIIEVNPNLAPELGPASVPVLVPASVPVLVPAPLRVPEDEPEPVRPKRRELSAPKSASTIGIPQVLKGPTISALPPANLEAPKRQEKIPSSRSVSPDTGPVLNPPVNQELIPLPPSLTPIKESVTNTSSGITKPPIELPIQDNLNLPQLNITRRDLEETEYSDQLNTPQRITVPPQYTAPGVRVEVPVKPERITRGRSVSPENGPVLNPEIDQSAIPAPPQVNQIPPPLPVSNLPPLPVSDLPPLPVSSLPPIQRRRELSSSKVVSNLNTPQNNEGSVIFTPISLDKLKLSVKLCKDIADSNLNLVKSLKRSYNNSYKNILLSIEALSSNNLSDFEQKKYIVFREKSTIDTLDLNTTISKNVSSIENVINELIDNPATKQTVADYFKYIKNSEIDSQDFPEFEKLIPNITTEKQEILQLLKQTKNIYFIYENTLKSSKGLNELLSKAIEYMTSTETSYKKMVDIDVEKKSKLDANDYNIKKINLLKIDQLKYIEYVKTIFPEINRLIRFSTNDTLTSIIPYIIKKFPAGPEATYLEIKRIESQLHGNAGILNVADESNYKINVPKILNKMINEYDSKYENIITEMNDLVSQIRLNESIISNLNSEVESLKLDYGDLTVKITEVSDINNTTFDKIYAYNLDVLFGGDNQNNELLYNALSAFLIKNTKQKNLKTLIISLITNNLTIKNNNVYVEIPSINDILKIISLPLYCTDKGINVTYSKMQKCVKKNYHKLLNSNSTIEYSKQLSLNSDDKILAKEFNRRVKDMNKIINKY